MNKPYKIHYTVKYPSSALWSLDTFIIVKVPAVSVLQDLYLALVFWISWLSVETNVFHTACHTVILTLDLQLGTCSVAGFSTDSLISYTLQISLFRLICKWATKCVTVVRTWRRVIRERLNCHCIISTAHCDTNSETTTLRLVLRVQFAVQWLNNC